jgi:hypothetical protein
MTSVRLLGGLLGGQVLEVAGPPPLTICIVEPESWPVIAEHWPGPPAAYVPPKVAYYRYDGHAYRYGGTQ